LLSRQDGKAPIDKDFYDGGALAEDDPLLLKHLAAGNGYGLVGTFGDLIAFDADDSEGLEALGIMSRPPPTLTDRAPNKPERLHLNFICPGRSETFHFYHPTKTVERGEGEIRELKRLELGQICAGRGHIVGPNSPHHKGGRREIIDDSPLAEITPDDLRAILRGLAFSEDPTKNPTFDEAAGLEDPAGRWDDLEEIARKARRGRRGDGPSLSERIGGIERVLTAYNWRPTTTSGDNWKMDHPSELSKSKTALVVNVAKNVWHCKHHEKSGGDTASLVALFEGLITCREHHRLERDSELFQAVLRACEEKALISPEEDGGRGESSTEEARDYLETVRDGLIEDPRKLKTRDVLAALLTLRERDPLEFDLIADELKAAGVVKLPTLKRMIDGEERRQADEKARGEEGGPEVSEEIKREADRIISAGESFEYIYKIWQSRHLGDAKAGKALIISTGAQSCTNTAGINVILNGPRGCGKSDILQRAAELMAEEYVLFGNMSPQAIYYHAELMPAGAIIAYDDITWNDTFASVQKRCTTKFQDGADHRTVIDGKPKTHRTKERLAFWCTSVDRQFDEQVQDRYWSHNVEDTPTHKAEVIGFMKARDAGIDREVEERETAICRAIIRDLKDHLFEVVLPFAERITVLEGVGERGYKILSDLVKAFCAFRYAVREVDDRGRLIATEEDFQDAKTLFDAAEGHGEEKYTEVEKKVLRALINSGYVATLENLRDGTGLSSGRLKDILNGRGRDEQKRYGLLAKCPVLTVERVSETVYFEPEAGKPKSKTVTRNEYRMDRTFSLSEVYNSLVYLEPTTRDDDVPRRRVDVVVDVEQNDVRREGDVVDVEIEREREVYGTSGASQGGVPDGLDRSEGDIPISPKTPEDTSTSPKRATGGGSGGVNHYVRGTSGVRRGASGTSTSDEEEARSPTAEEAAVLEEVAGKLLQNWNGIMETRLWEMARDKLGSPLPVAVVRVWLRASGYLKTAESMNGSPWWNPPAAGVV
jgi:hypothetical protein